MMIAGLNDPLAIVFFGKYFLGEKVNLQSIWNGAKEWRNYYEAALELLTLLGCTNTKADVILFITPLFVHTENTSFALSIFCF
jgi:hypothetical protein